MPIEDWSHLMAAWADKQRRIVQPAAMICSVLANVNRDPKTKKTPFTVDDFMPSAAKAKEEPEVNDENKLLSNIQAFLNFRNGTS